MEVYVDPERSYEIVDGQPEEKKPAGAMHGAVDARLAARLDKHTETHYLGVVCIEADFQIGTNLRIPDIAFVSAARIPPEGIPEGTWDIPPHLAIEIISPNDLQEKVTGKVLEYGWSLPNIVP